MFQDDGHSGASLVRPALERLRDLVCQVPVDVLLVYSPDQLARKYAYQALLIEELAKAGTSVMFVRDPRGDSPEDALLVQFQGMIAEYERAQILERTRRGKTHRARADTVNVLSGAPFGYRYVRKSEHTEASYQIVPHEAAIVTGLFDRYADGGMSIAELTRWLTGLSVPTRTGKTRWDRSTVWGMLRNPAYPGRSCFGKTMRTEQTAGLNRTARLAGRDPTLLHRHRPAARRQQALRHAQQQGPVAAAGHLRLRRLRLRLLPHLDPHHEQDHLLLPLSRLRRLPLPARPGLRQQTGPRRLSRHHRLGPHHYPARRPGPDPDRDQQPARTGPQRRPRHRPTPTTRRRTHQGHHGDPAAHRRLPRAADLPR
jgi:DNA invertase Pin-like site-specific DNA recombinase